MTNREYFEQAIWLDRKINSLIREEERLRELTMGISALTHGNRVQTSRPHEASFVRGLEKIMALEERINREIDALVDLKAELREVIDAVPCEEEQMVLRCRYLCCMSWEEVSKALGVNPRTVRRWHASALEHTVQPEKIS